MIPLKTFYHVAQSHFSPEWCDKVIDSIEKSNDYETHERYTSFRSSEVIFFQNDDSTKWIYESCYDLLDDVKAKYWRTFKLGSLNRLQYTIYNSPGGKYNWHTDTGQPRTGMNARLLTVAVQLTDSSDYSGGEFQIAEHMASDLNESVFGQTPDDKYIKQPETTRGTAILFPSMVQHRVLPMKTGTRRSLIGWCDGRFI